MANLVFTNLDRVAQGSDRPCYESGALMAIVGQNQFLRPLALTSPIP